jgi:CRISPR-associated protein Cas5d
MVAVEHTLEVWGDFACWTRPELKVERWSYPCPTPSGVRGIFDAIFCKPHNHQTDDENSAEFRWQVTRIELLSPPSYIALRRNEVSNVGPSDRTVQLWANGKAPQPLMADDPSVRQQRQTMALRNVRFRVTGQIVPWSGLSSKQKSLDEQFVRRASHGKCFQQPYLGCREFVAFYRYLPPGMNYPVPCDWSSDLGLMVYDVFDLSTPGRNTSRPFVSLFHAKVDHGRLQVPNWDDPRVLKPDRRAG